MSEIQENEAVETTDETAEPDAPEVTEVDPAEESEVTGGPEYPVVESTLSDEEKQVQEAHEALADELAPGQTLPWVAETPSVVYDQIVAEAEESAE